MGAPKGNQYWKKATTHGRKAIFTDPELLLEEFENYIEKVDNNPWYKLESIKSGDLAGSTFKVPMQRPYTIGGFCAHLGVGKNYFQQFEAKRAKEFSGVLAHIQNVIATQKFEGAAIGAFNPIIIARDLGLVDRKDHTTGGESMNNGYYDLLRSRKTKKTPTK